jgi:hypothetical protein
MTVFGCRACGTVLTIPVSEVALPVHAPQRYGNGPGSLDPALEPGTFAVDPLPRGAPSHRWAELEDGEAEALGWFAPRFSVSRGPAGHVLLVPGDVRNAVIDPGLVSDTACCGIDGGEPNMVCTGCGTPVATRIDDCGVRQAVWLDPRATHVIDDGPGPHPPLGWAELLDQRPGVPPTEPDGEWNTIWPAAIGSALAHVLAASDGGPILIPDQRVADIFRRFLDRIGDHSDAGPERVLTMAGPGLPAADGGIALVPEHPQTGEPWPVADPVKPVPLAWDVWAHLAFHRDPKPVGRSVPLRPEALPVPLPAHPVEPDGTTFLRVLARLPEVRQPWLRDVYEGGHRYGYSHYFF